MSYEVYSYLFDFHISPLFFENGWNDRFTVNAMKQNANNFEVVYCTHAPININECLTGGVLNNNVTVHSSVPLNLKYEDGVISVRADSTFNIGNNVIPLKAVFIRDANTKFVLGYDIHNTAFDVTNQILLAKDTIIWSLTNG